MAAVTTLHNDVEVHKLVPAHTLITRVEELTSPNHVHDLANMAERHHSECGGDLPFSREAVYDYARPLSWEPHRRRLNAWVAYKGELSVGYGVGQTARTFFNYCVTGSMTVWYVAPEYRGTRAAYRLMKAFEEWARLNGATLLNVGVTRFDPREAERIGELFPRLGYTWQGSTYVKETAHG